MTADVIVGERVHQLLWRARLSQTELAKMLGIAQPNVSKRLRGETAWTVDELMIVARSLGVPLADLLPGDDYDPIRKDGVVVAGTELVRHQGLEPRTRWLRAVGEHQTTTSGSARSRQATSLRLVASQNAERALLSPGRARPTLRLIITELAS